MNKFWQYLKDSIIIQGAVTMAFVITCCYLWWTGQTVPDRLFYCLTFVLGFFFGAKIQQILRR